MSADDDRRTIPVPPPSPAPPQAEAASVLSQVLRFIGLGTDMPLVHRVERLWLVAFAIGLWWFWEHRDTAIPSILGNQPALWGIAGAIVVSIVARLASWLSSRMDEQMQEMQDRFEACTAETAQLRAAQADALTQLARATQRLRMIEGLLGIDENMDASDWAKLIVAARGAKS